ncbi:MAG: DUF2244 domain-containing protein [Burkholderiales bacterium]|nr:MAG: DUF2244 domain-containing protein [Burkholderiales bacterium]
MRQHDLQDSGVASSVDRREWMLRRNCSLAPLQLAAIFASLALVSAVIATVVALNGGWMVVPFTCLEVAALAFAFVVYGRHAADFERIVLEPGRLVVESVSGNRSSRFEAMPGWTRVEYEGGRRSLVTLVNQGRATSIGRFLPEPQRERLARELRMSLQGA